MDPGSELDGRYLRPPLTGAEEQEAMLYKTLALSSVNGGSHLRPHHHRQRVARGNTVVTKSRYCPTFAEGG
jgi:hypothetical protein